MKATGYNSTYTQAGFRALLDRKVQNLDSVLRGKFGGNNPCLRVAANRYQQFSQTKPNEVF